MCHNWLPQNSSFWRNNRPRYKRWIWWNRQEEFGWNCRVCCINQVVGTTKLGVADFGLTSEFGGITSGAITEMDWTVGFGGTVKCGGSYLRLFCIWKNSLWISSIPKQVELCAKDRNSANLLAIFSRHYSHENTVIFSLVQRILRTLHDLHEN